MSEKFIVETSARHVHLTAEAFAVLFGEGKELTVKKMLSQPGQFASEERVTIVGPKKELPNVSILGPFRSANQVELSATDARSIGIAAPVRESGDVAGSGACTIVGPAGQLEISETDGRKAILGDVVCRVSPNYATAMHIDTDESNAIGAGRNQMGEIVTVD